MVYYFCACFVFGYNGSSTPLMFLAIKLTDFLKVDSSGVELKFSNSITGLNSEKVAGVIVLVLTSWQKTL